jgi:hypothetical protein
MIKFHPDATEVMQGDSEETLRHAGWRYAGDDFVYDAINGPSDNVVIIIYRDDGSGDALGVPTWEDVQAHFNKFMEDQ